MHNLTPTMTKQARPNLGNLAKWLASGAVAAPVTYGEYTGWNPLNPGATGEPPSLKEMALPWLLNTAAFRGVPRALSKGTHPLFRAGVMGGATLSTPTVEGIKWLGGEVPGMLDTGRKAVSTDRARLALGAGVGIGALGLGALGLNEARKARHQLEKPKQVRDPGLVRITLPTADPHDNETQIELPLDHAKLTQTAVNQLRRDLRRRLRQEGQERTMRHDQPIPDVWAGAKAASADPLDQRVRQLEVLSGLWEKPAFWGKKKPDLSYGSTDVAGSAPDVTSYHTGGELPKSISNPNHRPVLPDGNTAPSQVDVFNSPVDGQAGGYTWDAERQGLVRPQTAYEPTPTAQPTPVQPTVAPTSAPTTQPQTQFQPYTLRPGDEGYQTPDQRFQQTSRREGMVQGNSPSMQAGQQQHIDQNLRAQGIMPGTEQYDQQMGMRTAQVGMPYQPPTPQSQPPAASPQPRPGSGPAPDGGTPPAQPARTSTPLVNTTSAPVAIPAPAVSLGQSSWNPQRLVGTVAGQGRTLWNNAAQQYYQKQETERLADSALSRLRGAGQYTEGLAAARERDLARLNMQKPTPSRRPALRGESSPNLLSGGPQSERTFVSALPPPSATQRYPAQRPSRYVPRTGSGLSDMLAGGPQSERMFGN